MQHRADHGFLGVAGGGLGGHLLRDIPASTAFSISTWATRRIGRDSVDRSSISFRPSARWPIASVPSTSTAFETVLMRWPKAEYMPLLARRSTFCVSDRVRQHGLRHANSRSSSPRIGAEDRVDRAGESRHVALAPDPLPQQRQGVVGRCARVRSRHGASWCACLVRVVAAAVSCNGCLAGRPVRTCGRHRPAGQVALDQRAAARCAGIRSCSSVSTPSATDRQVQVARQVEHHVADGRVLGATPAGP